MNITVQHVADAAGVSRSTANMILIGQDAKYSPKTRTRVREAAAKLDYRPNITARSLKHRRSFLIGAVFSHLNAPYMCDFMAGLQAAAAEHGCAPTLFVTHDAASEIEAIRILRERRVDALLVNISPGADSSRSMREIQAMHTEGMPIIEVFGRTLAPGISNVIADAYIAGRNAAQAMIEWGCTRPVHLTSGAFSSDTPRTAENWFALDLQHGFCDAVSDAGLEPRCIPLTSEQVGANGVALARQVLTDEQPDGVLTLSHTLTREIIINVNVRPDAFAPHFTLSSNDTILRHHRFCRNFASIHWAIREATAQATQQLIGLIDGETPRDIALGTHVEVIRPQTTPTPTPTPTHHALELN